MKLSVEELLQYKMWTKGALFGLFTQVLWLTPNMSICGYHVLPTRKYL